MNLSRIYFAIPLWLQNLAITAYGVELQRRYYGREFETWMKYFDAHEFSPSRELNELQQERFLEIVRNASRYVPYYVRAFRHLNVSHDSLKVDSPSSLTALPILEKDVIREDATQLLDERFPLRQLRKYHTSGSTGTPLTLYWSSSMTHKWWALQESRVRKWAGVSQSMPRAMVGGRQIVRAASGAPYWRVNYFWRQLYMSAYHISSKTAASYIEAIRSHGAQWITGYGSAIALLAEWLHESGRTLPLAAAVTSGDNLAPFQRSIIEQGFQTRVFDNYGSHEGCVVASECHHGNMHVQPESAVVEIIDENGHPCAAGTPGHLIVTGLLNDAMPLIRYRTGDLASWSTLERCPCGRQSKILGSIDGRADDYIVLPDGRRIGRLSTAFRSVPTIRTAQIVQDAPDHLWLLVQPEPRFSKADGHRLIEEVLWRVGTINISLAEVERIPRTPTGKQRLVVRLTGNESLKAAYQAQLGSVRLLQENRFAGYATRTYR